ncbi:hypothetical protein DYB37_008689 [Aphanomyces astaci]|uniref:N-acetyltransferase domain-containing protein n=1 Tax=Aphanomyces astaci TaxID=112090 RepID=A0A3R7AW28_APHAT|nr:hypothetical protein DYB35_012498 [Aphanomyces astaci]RHZ19442.1 hypothetical protein DYB37_008689 [Aphanomyces astaci]
MTVTIDTRPATAADASFLLTCINDAFKADAFFKTKEHFNRVSMADVLAMLAAPRSMYLIAEISADGCKNNLCGCIYVQWTVHQDATVVGNFSSVSVRNEFERRGVGGRLVQAAELLVASQATSQEPSRMDISVVSARPDLFAFYERKGYRVTGNVIDSPEFAAILNDTHRHVHLVEMQKMLPGV